MSEQESLLGYMAETGELQSLKEKVRQEKEKEREAPLPPVRERLEAAITTFVSKTGGIIAAAQGLAGIQDSAISLRMPCSEDNCDQPAYEVTIRSAAMDAAAEVHIARLSEVTSQFETAVTKLVKLCNDEFPVKTPPGPHGKTMVGFAYSILEASSHLAKVVDSQTWFHGLGESDCAVITVKHFGVSAYEISQLLRPLSRGVKNYDYKTVVEHNDGSLETVFTFGAIANPEFNELRSVRRYCAGDTELENFLAWVRQREEKVRLEVNDDAADLAFAEEWLKKEHGSIYANKLAQQIVDGIRSKAEATSAS